MAISTSTRTHLWNALFLADMRSRFYQSRAQFYRNIEQACTVMTAVCGSAAFISTLSSALGLTATQWLTAFAAIPAVVLAMTRPGDRARLAANLATKNNECLGQYDTLWARQEAISDDEVFAATERGAASLQPLETEALRLIAMPKKQVEIAYREAELAHAHG